MPAPPDRFQELIPFIDPNADQADTRAQAKRAAARWSKVRYRQILTLLEEQPLCIFEVAAAISVLEQKPVHDHQVSGRFGTMVDAGLIAKSPARRRTPTGSEAVVYQITLAGQAVLQEGGANAV